MKARLLISALGVTIAVTFVMGQTHNAKKPESSPTSQSVSRDTSSQTTKPGEQRHQRGPFPIRWVNPGGKKPPGVKHHIFHCVAMGRDVGFNIYTPPDYATSDKRYPVIYWLHGGPGDETTGVPHSIILHQAIQEKRLPPMIIVFVNGGRGSFYYDAADGTIMSETALIKELIPLIDKNYRTIADRKARAIEGFSMGGFGALKLAFKYPDLFCSVVSGAPALLNWAAVSRKRERSERIFNSNPKAFESDHPSKLARKNADRLRGKLRIRIVVGDKDGLKQQYIDPFHELLNELNIPHEYEVLKGLGHSRGKVYQAAGLKGFQFHAKSFSAR